MTACRTAGTAEEVLEAAKVSALPFPYCADRRWPITWKCAIRLIASGPYSNAIPVVGEEGAAGRFEGGDNRLHIRNSACPGPLYLHPLDCLHRQP